MRLNLRGKFYDIDKEEAVKKLTGVKPEITGRTKYYIKINNKEFPIKQALAVVFGIARIEIQSVDAYRVLKNLGFEITEK